MEDSEIHKRIDEVNALAPKEWIALRAREVIDVLLLRLHQANAEAKNAAQLQKLIGKMGRHNYPLMPDAELGQNVALIGNAIDTLRDRLRLLEPKKVVGAIIHAPGGKVIIGQRRPDQWQPNMWCFPGGKVEPGETTTYAVQREIKEELDLDVYVGAHRHTQLVQYENGVFELNYFDVTFPFGQVAKPLAFQNIATVDPDDLPNYAMLKVDCDIARLLAIQWNLKRVDTSCRGYIELLGDAAGWLEDFSGRGAGPFPDELAKKIRAALAEPARFITT